MHVHRGCTRSVARAGRHCDDPDLARARAHRVDPAAARAVGAVHSWPSSGCSGRRRISAPRAARRAPAARGSFRARARGLPRGCALHLISRGGRICLPGELRQARDRGRAVRRAATGGGRAGAVVRCRAQPAQAHHRQPQRPCACCCGKVVTQIQSLVCWSMAPSSWRRTE